MTPDDRPVVLVPHADVISSLNTLDGVSYLHNTPRGRLSTSLARTIRTPSSSRSTHLSVIAQSLSNITLSIVKPHRSSLQVKRKNWTRVVCLFSIYDNLLEISSRDYKYKYNRTTNKICRAQLTKCQGVLANKCQNTRWKRWVFKRFLNLFVSVVSLILPGKEFQAAGPAWLVRTTPIIVPIPIPHPYPWESP